jgi:hypothetical protein
MEDKDMIAFLINMVRELEEKNSKLSHEIESLSNPIESPERVIALSALVLKDIESKHEKTKPDIDRVVNLIIRYGNQFV